MKKNIVLFCALSSMHYGIAQQVTSNGGESYSVPQYASVHFTIGETVIETLSATNDLTQGFHQTKWSFVSIDDNEITYSTLVYPNPFQDELILELPESAQVSCQLINANGKVVFEEHFQSTENSITTGEMAAGAYTLLLQDEQKIKTIKLIKNQ